MGSAPMVHVAAVTDHPVRQATFGIVGVFADTVRSLHADGWDRDFDRNVVVRDDWAELTSHAFTQACRASGAVRSSRSRLRFSDSRPSLAGPTTGRLDSLTCSVLAPICPTVSRGSLRCLWRRRRVGSGLGGVGHAQRADGYTKSGCRAGLGRPPAKADGRILRPARMMISVRPSARTVGKARGTVPAGQR